MHSDQRRLRLHIAHHQRHRFFYAAGTIGPRHSPKAVNPEPAPAGREVNRRNLLDFVFTHVIMIAAAVKRRLMIARTALPNRYIPIDATDRKSTRLNSSHI